MALSYRFVLSDDEFRRAWLAEYYRRPGWRSLRLLGGPALVALGAIMLRSPAAFQRVMGVVALLFGIYYAVKPWLAARVVTRERRRSGRADLELEVTLHGRGVTIDDGKVQTELPWYEVSSSGMGKDYVWYEVRGGARATIPLRVVDDLEALIERLRTHTDWKGAAG